MSSMANLADAMLVLAVGIMIAVVMGWKLDLKSVGSDLQARPINQDQIEIVDKNQLQDDQVTLEELGTLYYDQDSGTYYILNK